MKPAHSNRDTSSGKKRKKSNEEQRSSSHKKARSQSAAVTKDKKLKLKNLNGDSSNLLNIQIHASGDMQKSQNLYEYGDVT